MKKFVVRNNATGREYIVEGNENTSLDGVWMSQKCWFSTGSSITITAEDGTSQIYTK